jgi:transcriptional regulator with AAA-type ATPase domain
MLSFSDAERSPLSIRATALVFVDPASRQLQQQMERLAPAPLPLLIQGETGTGKELLARAIHRDSERTGLFVGVNCAALSRQHGAAELFGYMPGAATRTRAGRTGWYGSANGGTLYLDEIADLPRPLQRQLLLALQTGEIQRIGSECGTRVDVRLVAASSIDLTRAVAAGTFEPQLYEYLIDGLLILPALRQRPADIQPLAEYFLAMHAQRLDLPVPALTDQAMTRLQAYPWPGNTRELENAIHFALLISRDRVLDAADISLAWG